MKRSAITVFFLSMLALAAYGKKEIKFRVTACNAQKVMLEFDDSIDQLMDKSLMTMLNSIPGAVAGGRWATGISVEQNKEAKEHLSSEALKAEIVKVLVPYLGKFEIAISERTDKNSASCKLPVESERDTP